MSLDNNKELLGVRVWNVAKEYNISMVSVQDVINEFVTECRRTVVSGRVLRLFGLITILPNKLSDDSTPTLGYLCSKVSSTTSISYHTVFAVVSSYLLTVKEEILSMRNADIRRLASFHCIKTSESSTEFKVNCYMSASLRNEIRESDFVGSARVSQSDFLRLLVKEGVV